MLFDRSVVVWILSAGNWNLSWFLLKFGHIWELYELNGIFKALRIKRLIPKSWKSEVLQCFNPRIHPTRTILVNWTLFRSPSPSAEYLFLNDKIMFTSLLRGFTGRKCGNSHIEGTRPENGRGLLRNRKLQPQSLWDCRVNSASWNPLPILTRRSGRKESWWCRCNCSKVGVSK